MNEKMIHDYLEGELDSAEQDLLFAELNNNSQLRDDFQYQMKLNKTMEMDRNATNTPTELTAALFNRLNYSIPTNSNAKLVSRRRTYFWRYATAMLLLLFISIPAGLMIRNNSLIEGGNQSDNFANYPNDANSIQLKNSNTKFVENNTNKITNSEDKIQSSNVNSIAKSKVENNTESNNLLSDKFTKGEFLINNNATSSVNNKEDSNDRMKYPNNNLAIIAPADFVNNSDYYFSDNNINNTGKISNSNSNSIFNISPFLQDIMGLLSKENFEININIRNSINNNPPSTLNVTNNIYDNMAVSLWYNLNYGFNAGIEFGRESFNQSFSTNTGLVYNQVPTLNYIGFGLRYTAYHIELPLETVPYLQIKGSATTIGPIFDMQTGLNIASYSKISLRFGIEYSTLFYNVNSNIYNSGKVNLIGGLVYSF